MRNRIPGKTFLVGEYSVLLNGAALGLATQPCFEIVDEKEEATEIHPHSPAGRYLTLDPSVKKKSVRLKDPYLAMGVRGGFGRSTAEFFSVLDEATLLKPFTDIREIYLDLHRQEKILPSGADLAFQYFGGVCLADLKNKNYRTLSWPFANLHFFILATGLKIATYEHLAEINLANLAHLPRVSDLVIKSFIEQKQDSFILGLRDWTQELAAAGLTHSHSAELRATLESVDGVLAAKPCGALGADVILVFCQTEHSKNIRNKMQNLKLQIVAEVDDLYEGFGPNVG